MSIPEGHRYQTTLGGRELIIETGKYAKQVPGSILMTYGANTILVTAHMSDNTSPMDFLPLTVEYEERHYAIGKIPGSFLRREGRPGTQAILNARITDRQIRPLFPKHMRNEIQVLITILGADQVSDPGPIAAIGVSAALSISAVPWDGPTACGQVGYIDGEYVLNPTFQQLAEANSQLELTVAITKDAVLMVEALSDELPEDIMVGAIEFAQRELAPVIELIEKMQREIGIEKNEIADAPELPAGTLELVAKEVEAADLRGALLTKGKHLRSAALKSVRNSIIEKHVPDTEAEDAAAKTDDLKAAYKKAEQATLRRMVTEESLRTDGRKPSEIRPIWIEVGVLPTAHGSAVFTRGETQVLGVTTLGTGRDNRLVDDLSIEGNETFMLHYNFPPYSTGEVKRLRGVSRREMGHGNLAKRALQGMLPNQADFPYVTRVVGEVLESNGSSSMATVCAGSLSLMDAGVPMQKPVAGIAMGMVKEGEKYAILSDILGSEDALGDMDFKVTGTRDGVTALQMDIKIKGITSEIMKEALNQAKDGRVHILGEMDKVLDAPREEVNERAPRIMTVNIPADKIGTVIGPGGKQIRELESYGATVEIEEDGTVRIYSESGEAAKKVAGLIEGLTATVEVGKVYEGKVAKIMDFGAFINIMPGTDGLLHISQIAEERVENVRDFLKEGDELTVKVNGVDNRGKIDLIRPELEGKIAPRRTGGGGRDGGNRGGGRGGDRGGRGGNNRPPRD